MGNSEQIINWKNFEKNSDSFKNNKPFRFVFIEDCINDEFYEKIFQTYPKYDDSWVHYQDYSRSSRNFELDDPKTFLEKEKTGLSEAWKKFIKYLISEDFIKNISKFSEIDFKKVVYAGFINSHKGDFSLPHIDGYTNPDGTVKAKANILIYFNKGWQKGDPGGTYICKSEDESDLIFEPYNLENSLVMFEQGPNSWHGSRFITKDVKRQAFSFALG